MELSILGRPVTKPRLHMIIGGLVLLVFILTISRLAIKGTPSARANSWGIAVVMILNTFHTYYGRSSFEFNSASNREYFSPISC
jgi:hypothetical protein